MAVEAADADEVPAPSDVPAPGPDTRPPAASADVCVCDAKIDLGAAQRSGRKSKRKVDFLLIEMTISGFDFTKAHVTYMALLVRVFVFGRRTFWVVCVS